MFKADRAVSILRISGALSIEYAHISVVADTPQRISFDELTEILAMSYFTYFGVDFATLKYAGELLKGKDFDEYPLRALPIYYRYERIEALKQAAHEYEDAALASIMEQCDGRLDLIERAYESKTIHDADCKYPEGLRPCARLYEDVKLFRSINDGSPSVAGVKTSDVWDAFVDRGYKHEKIAGVFSLSEKMISDAIAFEYAMQHV